MSSVDSNSANSASTASFVSSLVFNSAVFGAEILVFTFVRPYFRLIYEPRSLAVLPSKRTNALASSLLGWPLAILKADYRSIKDINGMDAYFFVRFLRMMVRVLLPIWLISWPVLMPIMAAGTSVSDHSGLDKFTFGNIASDKLTRFAGLIILTWLFTIWIWWNIKHEMRHFVQQRQHYLISPQHSSTAQASTILITGLPTEYLSESALIRLFSHLPGGVRKVWVTRDLKDMPDLYDRQLKASKKLEAAETSLINTAIKRHNKQLKKEAKASKKAGKDNIQTTSAVALTRPSLEEGDPESARSSADKLVPQKKRPTHRLPIASWMPFSLPLVGKKVDTIEWAREEIKTTTAALEERRRVLEQDIAHTTAADAQARKRVHQLHAGRLNINVRVLPVNIPLVGPLGLPDFSDQTYPPVNGAFVLFHRQIAAHLAVQSLLHHEPYRMPPSGKYAEVAPEGVIWQNLSTNPYERRVRLAISWAATIGLIILWAFPVAFIGGVSNVKALSTTYTWLSWLNDLPKPVIGIIQGVLPPVLLALLLLLVPIVMRLLARFEGIPTRSGVELSLMDRFFLFEVINGFLIVTFASGIIASLPGLVNNPSNVPTLLANHLPQASTFFLTFVLLQGLSNTAGGFLQIVPLVLYYVKLFLLGSTPRSVYNIKYGARTVEWGTLFPQTTLLVVITLGYSIISPIINGLACATFFLFYCLYKYIFIWVNDQPQSGDTGGLFFPKAIQHIFVGMYIQQICLAALFFLAQNDHEHPGAVAEGALMIVLIVFTAFFHNTINNSYGPLLHHLPLSLADQSHGAVRTDIIREEDENAAASNERVTGKKSSFESEHKSMMEMDKREPSLRPDVEIADEPEQGSSSKVSGVGESAVAVRPADASSRAASPADHPEGDDFHREVNEGVTDFSPPAAFMGQQTVWIPRDPLGLYADVVRQLREDGIDVDTAGAEMDAKGHVNVTAAPPGTDSEVPPLASKAVGAEGSHVDETAGRTESRLPGRESGGESTSEEEQNAKV